MLWHWRRYHSGCWQEVDQLCCISNGWFLWQIEGFVHRITFSICPSTGKSHRISSIADEEGKVHEQSHCLIKSNILCLFLCHHIVKIKQMPADIVVEYGKYYQKKERSHFLLIVSQKLRHFYITISNGGALNLSWLSRSRQSRIPILIWVKSWACLIPVKRVRNTHLAM